MGKILADAFQKSVVDNQPVNKLCSSLFPLQQGKTVLDLSSLRHLKLRSAKLHAQELSSRNPIVKQLYYKTYCAKYLLRSLI